jgi:hypothetical protein
VWLIFCSISGGEGRAIDFDWCDYFDGEGLGFGGCLADFVSWGGGF